MQNMLSLHPQKASFVIGYNAMSEFRALIRAPFTLHPAGQCRPRSNTRSARLVTLSLAARHSTL